MSAWASRRLLLGLLLGTLLPVLPSHASSRVFEDREFLDGDWEHRVFTTGYGGTGEVARIPDSGLPGAHQKVRINLRANSSTVGSGASVFSKHLQARYNPAVEGPIFSINFTEDAIRLEGSGAGHRLALGLEQDGKFFFSPEPRVFSPEDTWTTKRQLGLRAEDFSPVSGSGSTGHPDFSTNGSEIIFGSFQANSAPAGNQHPYQPGDETPWWRAVGIDNWKVELILTDCGGAGSRLPCPGLYLEGRLSTLAVEFGIGETNRVLSDSDAFIPPPGQNISNQETTLDLHSNPPLSPGDPDPFPGRAQAGARADFFATAGARAVAFGQQNIGSGSVGMREVRVHASSRRVSRFVATGRPPGQDVTLNLLLHAEGVFTLSSLMINNPYEPVGSQIYAAADLEVLLHRESGSTRLARGYARVDFDSSHQVRLTATDAWQGALEFPPPGVYGTAVLNYTAVPTNAVVPVGEEFAIEFQLETEAYAGDYAGFWQATADFLNTAGYELQPMDEGVVVTEAAVEPDRRLRITRLSEGCRLWLPVQEPLPALQVESSEDLQVWNSVGTMEVQDGLWVLETAASSRTPSYYRATQP